MNILRRGVTRHGSISIFLGAGCLGLMAAVAGGGCSHQDFSRPSVHNPLADVLDSGKPYVTDDRESDRREKMQKLLERWAVTHRGEEKGEYRVGPGDVLEISVFALESPQETSRLLRAVADDGSVSLPWVGSVKVAGWTPREVEKEIAAAYRGRFLKNPQVTVDVKEYNSVVVLVTGAVVKPGIYKLRHNRDTLLEILSMAGGLRADAGDEVLVVHRAGRGRTGLRDGLSTGGAEADGGTVVRIDLKALVDDGDLDLNVLVGRGDIVAVRPRMRRYVYVLGYVQRPGAFELKSGQKVDALKAVALAGGLSATARAQNSFLVREAKDGQTIIPIDLVKIAKGVRPPVYLRGGDTLVVGSGFLARLSEFVRPSVGAGVSYTPAP